MTTAYRSMGHFAVAADHPSLPGHFPGRPIVPGVVLLDYALALALPAGTRPKALHAVRFLEPIGPGEAVEVQAADAPPGRVRLLGTREGRPVLRANVVLAE